MQIAITGASGLIGSALSRSLQADGHTVRPVSRSASGPGSIGWDPPSGTIDAAALEGLDAVVHLAGEPIASGPWTRAQRARIHDSRSQGTDLLARTLAGLDRPPSVLVSGSAIGYYGDRGDQRLDEGAGPGSDFLASVCVDWEAATAPASAAGIRVVHLRTGIVLDRHGGALAKQLPLFRLGLGGKAGRGTQWLSWITLADEVRAIRHAIDTPALVGPANLAAPGAVTNAEFTRALGHAVHRPTLLPVPRFVRHAPFGVGALLDSLLFTSARVAPDALASTGFRFEHEGLEDAFDAVLADRGAAAS
jgi:uncharacterized protein (TIGR01777 family)